VKLAYVSGPYRSPKGWQDHYGVLRNIQRAEQVAVELWRRGFAVICPHKNTAFLDGVAPVDAWLQGDLVMVERCDLVVMVPGWETSEGANIEREHALRRGIPVCEWPDDIKAIAGG
jgi:hypothetical protein